jgi:hypothetical protein
MMAFTADGQVNRKLVEKRDADYGVSKNWGSGLYFLVRRRLKTKARF